MLLQQKCSLFLEKFKQSLGEQKKQEKTFLANWVNYHSQLWSRRTTEQANERTADGMQDILKKKTL